MTLSAAERTSAITDALPRWVGFTELRPMQREAIDAAYEIMRLVSVHLVMRSCEGTEGTEDG